MSNSPENDPIWDLLNKASTPEASEMFSRNVLRSIRLEEQQSTPVWRRLLTPAPIVVTLATAAACLALILNIQSPSPEASSPSFTQQLTAAENFAELSEAYLSNDNLDSVISPISLIATYDTGSLSELDLFLEL